MIGKPVESGWMAEVEGWVGGGFVGAGEVEEAGFFFHFYWCLVSEVGRGGEGEEDWGIVCLFVSKGKE